MIAGGDSRSWRPGAAVHCIRDGSAVVMIGFSMVLYFCASWMRGNNCVRVGQCWANYMKFQFRDLCHSFTFWTLDLKMGNFEGNFHTRQEGKWCLLDFDIIFYFPMDYYILIMRIEREIWKFCSIFWKVNIWYLNSELKSNLDETCIFRWVWSGFERRVRVDLSIDYVFLIKDRAFMLQYYFL